ICDHRTQGRVRPRLVGLQPGSLHSHFTRYSLEFLGCFPNSRGMHDGKWIRELTAALPLADAARRVLAIRLATVHRALPLAIQDARRDIEHVHQLRVATRRARAALDIFIDCLPDGAYRAAKKELRKIRRAAGAARDWDVFLAALTDAKRRVTAQE